VINGIASMGGVLSLLVSALAKKCGQAGCRKEEGRMGELISKEHPRAFHKLRENKRSPDFEPRTRVDRRLAPRKRKWNTPGDNEDSKSQFLSWYYRTFRKALGSEKSPLGVKATLADRFRSGVRKKEGLAMKRDGESGRRARDRRIMGKGLWGSGGGMGEVGEWAGG